MVSPEKGFLVTDFPTLKAKYPDLIPDRMRFECGAGWEGILDKYFAEVSQALTPGARLRLERVYEKYGSLRVNATAEGVGAPDLEATLEKAETLADSRSYRSCETCGEPGRLRDKRMLYVACEVHANGAPPLPPNDCRVRLNGDDYEYDEALDDLVVVARLDRDAVE